MATPPSNGRVSSPYGPRDGSQIGNGVGSFHYGEDTLGDGNDAPESGTIVFAGYAGSFGNAILVRRGDVVWNIAHHKNLNGRRRGQAVVEGERLAPMGSTGLAFGVHSHAEHRKGGGDSIQSGEHANPRIFYAQTAGGISAPFNPVEDDMYDEDAEARLMEKLDEVARVAAPYRVFAWGTGHLCVNPRNGRFWILPQGYGELLSHLGYRGDRVASIDDAQLGFVTGFFPSAVGDRDFDPDSVDGFTDADLESVKQAIAANKVAITEDQMETLVSAVGESARAAIEGVTFVVKAG